MVDQIETTFSWIIKQYDMYPQSNGVPLRSIAFSVGPYEFCLYLYPRGCKDNNDKYVSLFLERLNDCGGTEVSILYRMCLDDSKGMCTKYCWGANLYGTFEKHECVGMYDWIEINSVLIKERHNLLSNNNLTIKCKISLFPVGAVTDDDSKLCNEQAFESLSKDFGELLKTGIHSDMTIIDCDNKFNVHRAVLECRCPEITAHLKESAVQNEYYLPNIEASLLHPLLQYLYAGTCSVTNVYEEMSFISNAYCLPDFRSVFSYAQNISASTEINVSRLCFKWNISDFNKLQSDQELVYPAFYYSAHEWDKMKIILTRTKSEMELKFRRLCPALECFIRCKITFSTVNLPDIVREWEHDFEDEIWILALDLQSHQLIRMMSTDTLNLFFELCITNNVKTSKIETVSVDPKAQKGCVETIKNLNQLQQDYHTLYSNPNYSDVILCVGDSKLPAHKAVLCARSPVFAKMFEHDTLEKKEGVITIEEMNASTVSSVLQYMYCGCIDTVDIPETMLIYSAADKYELLELKDMCGTFLKSSINAENIIGVLWLADAHHDESLKRSVYEYMVSNPESVVLSEIELDKLNDRLLYPNVLKELLEYMASLKGSSISSSS